MEEYYFLFSLAAVWIIFASIQDIKKTEVSNWLNFSLVGFSLAYRAFYSFVSREVTFFLFGLAGFALFFIIAHIFYYIKVFGGGDAKLLMGIGVILPFESWKEMLFISLEFIFLLFLAGAIYSLIYSVFRVSRNPRRFKKEFKKEFTKHRIFLALSVIFSVLVLSTLRLKFGVILSLIALLLFWLFIYLKSFENSCLIVLKKPNELMEGDWIEKDVFLGKTLVQKTIHGLSIRDIKLLKKHNKSIIVKQGIPFVPAFLISLLIMVFAYFFLQSQLEQLISLFSRA